MKIMQKILNTSKIVKKALMVCPETRNSDSFLYLKVIEHQAIEKGMNIRDIPLPHFLENHQKWGFAPFLNYTEPPFSELTEIQLEAQKKGMSYGQYVASLQREDKNNG